MTSILCVGDAELVKPSLTLMREAGLLPVHTTSVDSAMHMLRQFSVAVAFVYAPELKAEDWGDCARLVATRTPVVVICGRASEDSINRYLSAGCTGVLCEPFLALDLGSVVRRIRQGERGIVEPSSGRHRAAV